MAEEKLIFENSLFWLSDWGSKYKIRTYDVFLTCRNLRVFWEDQMDPKLALGGPKPISRNGPRGPRCVAPRSPWDKI